MKKGIIGVLALCGALAMSGLAFAEGAVARSVFTSGVSEREPVDQLTTLTPDTTRLYFFTELRDMAGQTVTHRWEHGGKVISEVPFNVGAPRWRIWSSKSVEAGTAGEWTVSVVDGAGNELARQSIAPAAQ